MSTVFKVIAGVAAIWSAVYSVSFAANEFKNKRPAGGIASLASVAAMVLAYIKSIGF